LWIDIVLMPIRMRTQILPQVFNLLENQKQIITYIDSVTDFSASVKNVEFSKFRQYIEISRKKV
jgi:hypothetical protein